MSEETQVRITICGGTVAQIRTVGQCYGLCAKPDARRVVSYDASPYYDPTIACECGDSWSTEGLAERPFRRGWRKAAQDRFEADWANAAPEGSRVVRDDEHYAAAADSAIRSHGDEKDRKGLFGMLFGGSK